MASLRSVTLRYGCFLFPVNCTFSQDILAREGTFVPFLPPLAAVHLPIPVMTHGAEGPWGVAM